MASTLADAVAANDTAAVEAALKSSKSELNQANSSGELLLHLAIKAKSLNVAAALLEAGANVNQGSEERGTTKGYTAAHFAARAGDVDAIDLLKKHNADFNRQAADGWAPIHTACFAGKSSAVKRLVESGIDVNQGNDHGMTPLVFAANHGRIADVRLLIKNGAKVDFIDSNGDSLMHHALHFRLQEMFEGEYDMPECQFDVAVCLAVHGAPIDKPNTAGKPACEWLNECDMDAFQDVLKILSHNSAAILKAGGADMNYISLLAAQPQVYMAMGLDRKHANDLSAAVKKADEQRLAETKRKESERPAGGCPVMKGGRKKKGAKAIGDGGAAAAGAPAGHPDVNMADVPEGTDPSDGQCPFFAKKAKQAANSSSAAPAAPATPSPAAAPATAVAQPPVKAAANKAAAAVAPAGTATSTAADSGAAPALNWQFLYENRVVILLMLVSFFFGSYVEQKFGAASRGAAVRGAM